MKFLTIPPCYLAVFLLWWTVKGLLLLWKIHTATYLLLPTECVIIKEVVHQNHQDDKLHILSSQSVRAQKKTYGLQITQGGQVYNCVIFHLLTFYQIRGWTQAILHHQLKKRKMWLLGYRTFIDHLIFPPNSFATHFQKSAFSGAKIFKCVFKKTIYIMQLTRGTLRVQVNCTH